MLATAESCAHLKFWKRARHVEETEKWGRVIRGASFAVSLGSFSICSGSEPLPAMIASASATKGLAPVVAWSTADDLLGGRQEVIGPRGIAPELLANVGDAIGHMPALVEACAAHDVCCHRIGRVAFQELQQVQEGAFAQHMQEKAGPEVVLLHQQAVQ